MDNRRHNSYLDFNEKPQIDNEQEDDIVVKLSEENQNLRKKLKLLNYRLDQQLEKAAKDKFKTPRLDPKVQASTESLNNELKNAYKIIDRLKKSIKHYESNEGYNSSITKIIDLQDVIKKKEVQLQDLRTEVKTLKKLNKDRQRHIQQLNQQAKKVGNPAQDREEIHRLKERVKKLAAENEQLQKTNRQKHQKMIDLDMKARSLEKELEYERPIPEEVVGQGQDDIKAKYKEAVEKLAKQSALTVKYKDQIAELQTEVAALRQIINRKQKKEREELNLRSQRQSIEKSQKPNESLMLHVPSDHLPKRIRNDRGVFI